MQPGYMGGALPNPSYELVCGGASGYVEVVRIVYDPAVLPFEQLLAIFFAVHDPTTPNRQGADVGTQYRSAIFHTGEEQRRAAEAAIARLNLSGELPSPVVTTIEAASPFYPAEEYHRNYFARHPEQGYCVFVIAPKLEKFEKLFASQQKG